MKSTKQVKDERSEIYKIMKEELNKRFENVYESIEAVYYRLTHLNMQYLHLVRQLEETKVEMKTIQKELLLYCRLEVVNNQEHPCLEQLRDAPNKLNAGMQIITDVLPKMRGYVSTVNRLMDANDYVEDCLDMLDELKYRVRE